jgi:hypothetical protein
MIMLTEINIPGCYRGRVGRFNDWRRTLADMTGVALRYVVRERDVALTSRNSALEPPARLPFIEAELTPLLVLLLLTVPGGVVRHDLADAIAARLVEMTELMHGVDDGHYGTTDLGRLTEIMAAGFRRIGVSGADSPVSGGYEPSGWWDVAGRFARP